MRIILVGSVGTVKRLRVSLGTLVAIEATIDAPATNAGHGSAFTEATDVIAVNAAIERAFAAIEQINQWMHPTAAGSDLAKINSAPLQEPTKVHPSVGHLLNLARQINTVSDGAFDPCTPARPGRLSDIEVSGDGTEVVCHAPVALDFGGFAKGYAVDRAIEALRERGCTAGLVNAGGDLRVFGQRTEAVFVRGPTGELASIELSNAALAVSDITAQQRPPEHQGYYVRSTSATKRDSQRSEKPGSSIGTTLGIQPAAEYTTTYAAVVASAAAVADALTKCVLLCPAPLAARVLKAFGARAL